MNELTRINFDNIQDETIRPINLRKINPGGYGPNDIVTISADGEHFEIIPNFSPDWNALYLDKLTDIDITEPEQDGQILQFDGTASQWVNVMPAPAVIPALFLNDLDDVTETTPVDGDMLIYEFASTQYVNRKLDFSELDNIPLTFAPQAHSHSISHINDWPFSSPSIGDMTNVNLTGIDVGDILEWNGVSFVAGEKAAEWTVTAGDYSASQITNDSAVLGAFVSDALDALDTKVNDFVDLDDTPVTMTGFGGKILAVNGGGDAIEFVDPAIGGAISFLGLTDTPSFVNYAGQDGKVVVVNELANELEFAQIPIFVTSVFGQTGAIVASAGDYDASQIDNDSGVGGAFVGDALDVLNTALGTKPDTFLDLPDTPDTMLLANAGQYLVVNALGTEIAYASPPVVPTNISDLVDDSGHISDITGESVGSLTDVVITGATTGDLLRYAVSGDWVNYPETNYATGAEGDLAGTALQNLTGEDIGSLANVDVTGIGDGYHLEWNLAGNKFVVMPAPIVGSPTFIGLTDVTGPMGSFGQYVAVNGLGDLAFITPPTIPANVSDLANDSGFISDITGESIGSLVNVDLIGVSDGDLLAWSGVGSEFIVVPAPVSTTFIGLTDVVGPMGSLGQYVSVNGSGNLAFITPPGIPTNVSDLVDDSGHLSDLTGESIGSLLNVDLTGIDNGDHLVWSNAGSEFVAAVPSSTTFIGLTDVTGPMGSFGQYVAVNGFGDLAFITPPSIPANVSDLNDDSGHLSDITGEDIGSLANVDVIGIADGYILEWNLAGGKFVVVPAPVLGSTTFIGLTDVTGPMGSLGQYVAVDGSGNMAFVTPPTIPANVSDLNDDSGHISDITGEDLGSLANVNVLGIGDRYHLEWNLAGNEFVVAPTLGSTTFIGLIDVTGPMGSLGQYVAVDGSGNMAFITPPTIPANVSDLNDDSGHLSDITGEDIGSLANVNVTGIADGYHLEWNLAGNEFVVVAPVTGSTTFIGLTDVTGPMGSLGQYVAVDGSGNLVFITPPAVKTLLSEFTDDLDHISDITAEDIGTLANVDVTGIADGYILEWSLAGGKFVVVPAPIGGVSTFGALTDVEVTGVAIGDLVRWNGSQWFKYAETNFATGAEGDLASSALQSVVGDGNPVLGGNLDVSGNSIISSAAGNITLTPDATGSVVLDGSAWPQSTGTDTYMLVTNGSGQLSWAAQGSGSTFVALGDVTGPMGSLGQYVAVDGSGNLAFITPPAEKTLLSDFTNDLDHISDITGENFNDLADVNVPAPGDGDHLVWDNGTARWISAVPAAGGSSTFVGLTDVTGPMGSAGQIVEVNPGGTALQFANPAAGGSGFSTEWVKVQYTSGGTIDTVSVSDANVVVAITENTVNNNIRISITLNFANRPPPASIMSYGYVWTSNTYIVQQFNLGFGGGNAVVNPGGTSGSPGNITDFNTMALEEVQVSTSATGASGGGPVQPAHAYLIIGW